MPRFEDAAWELLDSLLRGFTDAPLVGGLVARRPRGVAGSVDGLLWSPFPPSRAPLPNLEDHLPSMRIWEIVLAMGEPIVTDLVASRWSAPRSGIERAWPAPSRSMLRVGSRARFLVALPLERDGMVVLELHDAVPDWVCFLRRAEATLADAGALVRLRPGTAVGERRILDFPVRPSPRMASTLRVLERFAATEEPLLLTGPPGAGKSSLAEACHRASRRAQGPFRATRLAAVPEPQRVASLVGWSAERGGLVSAVRGGTLFLDDIEGLGLTEQRALVEILDNHRIRPIFGTQELPVDLRLITATSVDLRERVRAGTFLPELLSRLEMLSVHVPSLAERREEIGDWVSHFLDREGSAMRLTDEGLAWIRRQPLTGNLRELASWTKRATLLGAGPHLDEGLLREVSELSGLDGAEQQLREAVRRLIGLADGSRAEEDLYDISDKLMTALLVDEWSRLPVRPSPLRRQQEAGNLSRSLERAQNTIALLRRWLREG